MSLSPQRVTALGYRNLLLNSLGNTHYWDASLSVLKQMTASLNGCSEDIVSTNNISLYDLHGKEFV